jgi:hypothetical protein
MNRDKSFALNRHTKPYGGAVRRAALAVQISTGAVAVGPQQPGPRRSGAMSGHAAPRRRWASRMARPATNAIAPTLGAPPTSSPGRDAARTLKPARRGAGKRGVTQGSDEGCHCQPQGNVGRGGAAPASQPEARQAQPEARGQEARHARLWLLGGGGRREVRRRIPLAPTRFGLEGHPSRRSARHARTSVGWQRPEGWMGDVCKVLARPACRPARSRRGPSPPPRAQWSPNIVHKWQPPAPAVRQGARPRHEARAVAASNCGRRGAEPLGESSSSASPGSEKGRRTSQPTNGGARRRPGLAKTRAGCTTDARSCELCSQRPAPCTRLREKRASPTGRGARANAAMAGGVCSPCLAAAVRGRDGVIL